MATQLRVPRFLRGYEHIIRDQPDYERIANYIASNPSNWAEDEENPALSVVEGQLRPTFKPVNL